MIKESIYLVPRWVMWVVQLIVLKFTWQIVLGYGSYFPPDFQSSFLWGREPYFHGPYHYAFYTHIVSGPLASMCGLLLLQPWLLSRYRRVHAWLGRCQAINVLVVLVPSGLFMAGYAQDGPLAGIGLAILALLTAISIMLGWRAAVERRFADHRYWMFRNFLLLCSTIVLRLLVGTLNFAGVDPLYLYAWPSWASWLLPLVIVECYEHRLRIFQLLAPRPQEVASS